MYVRFISSFLFLVSSAYSSSVHISQIWDLDILKNDKILVYLSNGQVASAHFNKTQIKDILLKDVNKDRWFEFTLGESNQIIKLKSLASKEHRFIDHKNDSHKIQSLFSPPYTPSFIENMSRARSLFYEAREDAKEDSQCYDRAHVWSYEWRIKHDIYSSKVWLFFTKKFIRQFNFKWWYHVAPSLHILIDNEIKERVMDMKYARGPLSLKQWTDIFLANKADCPVVEKYSDQANYPEFGSCFIMKSSMYFYQPVDLQRKELLGKEKIKWLQSEVIGAYKDAYDITL